MELKDVDDMVLRELEKRHVYIFSLDDLLDLIPGYEKFGDTIIKKKDLDIVKEIEEGNECLWV